MTMTASQAKSFDHYSHANANYVEHVLPCGCKAYQDIFTYKRWLALGWQVQRGEHGVKIPVIKRVMREEEGEPIEKRIFTTGAVFCRHQVKAVGEEGK